MEHFTISGVIVPMKCNITHLDYNCEAYFKISKINLLVNGHEFEQTLGNTEGQGSLVCCSSWGCKESDVTERLNNNNKKD